MKYLEELDGLRGIAILMVVAIHAHIPFASGGFIGVDLFFVLSGYLITSILISEHNKNGKLDLLRFYWRRCLRLLPALTCLLLCFITYGIVTSMDFNLLYRESLIVFFYAASWTRALYGVPSDWLGHTWSLSIEEQFYFIWPFLFSQLTKFSFNKIILFVTSSALVVSIYRYTLLMNGASTNRIFFGFDSRMDALIIGCLLAYLLSNKNILMHLSDYTYIINALTIVSSAFLILIFVTYSEAMAWLFSYGFLLIAISSAIIILSVRVNPKGVLTRILKVKILVYTGKISYGLYLWHWPVFYYLHTYTSLNTASKILIGIVLSYSISMISFYIVEKPMLKYKNKVGGDSRSAVAAEC